MNICLFASKSIRNCEKTWNSEGYFNFCFYTFSGRPQAACIWASMHLQQYWLHSIFNFFCRFCLIQTEMFAFASFNFAYQIFSLKWKLLNITNSSWNFTAMVYLMKYVFTQFVCICVVFCFCSWYTYLKRENGIKFISDFGSISYIWLCNNNNNLHYNFSQWIVFTVFCDELFIAVVWIKAYNFCVVRICLYIDVDSELLFKNINTIKKMPFCDFFLTSNTPFTHWIH